MNITFEVISDSRNNKPAPLEFMACVLSRQLKDGEMAGTGAGSAVARAACRLAQLTHAPNLNYVAGGSGAVNPYLEPLVQSSCDYTNLICESTLAMGEVIGPFAAGKADVFFYGGMQVDRFGNVNLSVIGDFDKPKVRGPGSAALPLLANARRAIIFMTDHSPRTFVEKVAFRTAPGFLDGGDSWRKAKAEGLVKGDGPALVVSTLAVMDFEEDSKAMRLVSVHPGVTVDQVKAATGFELSIPAEVPVTKAPTGQELEILRSLDQDGILRSKL